MADATIEAAKITPVYWKVGEFSNHSGQPKLLKAPYDLIFFGGDNYVMPCGTAFDYSFSEEMSYKEDRKGFGYVSNIMIMEEHEMGDYAGHPEDWRGFQQFGMI